MPISPDYHFYRIPASFDFPDMVIPTGTLVNSAVGSSKAYENDRLYTSPILITRATKLGFFRFTAEDGKKIKIGIYNTVKDPYNDLRPTSKFADFGEITIQLSNTEINTSDLEMPAGFYWWAGIFKDNPTNFRGLDSEVGGVWPILGSNITTGKTYTGWTAVQSYAGGLPSTFPTPTRNELSLQFLLGITC